MLPVHRYSLQLCISIPWGTLPPTCAKATLLIAVLLPFIKKADALRVIFGAYMVYVLFPLNGVVKSAVNPYAVTPRLSV